MGQGKTCAVTSDPLTCSTVRKPTNRRVAVCLCSFHPLAEAEFERHLSGDEFQLRVCRLESGPAPDQSALAATVGSVFVVEAHEHAPATETVVGGILTGHSGAKIIVVAEKLEERSAFPLLRQGVKGLLAFSDGDQQLARAVREVAGGGFWVPRTLLSRFVDDTLAAAPRQRPALGSGRLSGREKEVLGMLLENLSNKEIAARLNLSQRTVKFHVSNLLAKYGVKRRADLIVLTYTQRELPAATPS